MTVERLQAMLKEQPFRPFSIHTSDGEVVRVRGPEFAWLHPSKRTLYVARSAEEDREEIIDLLHITKVSTSKSDNGKPKP
jgi:hypothetical protein